MPLLNDIWAPTSIHALARYLYSHNKTKREGKNREKLAKFLFRTFLHALKSILDYTIVYSVSSCLLCVHACSAAAATGLFHFYKIQVEGGIA